MRSIGLTMLGKSDSISLNSHRAGTGPAQPMRLDEVMMDILICDLLAKMYQFSYS